MPRIDPLQLLNCLQVLLTRNGGIQSKDEVQRLANLMTKFSKKLVSKCIYILILKNTEPNLLDQFMSEGGWNLVMMWLQEAMANTNVPLMVELLELLTITPVNVERLKTNNIPKLVKNLTKRTETGVWQLSTKLVNTWLKIVKDQASQNSAELAKASATESVETLVAEDASCIATDTFYKLSVRDGKQVISKLGEEEEASEKAKTEEDAKKHKSTKSSSSRSSSRDKDREKDRRRSSSSSSSRNKSSSRDKDRKETTKDKSRHNGSSKTSPSSSKTSTKDKKLKQAEKDKDTLSKVLPQSTQKMARIPKKTSDDSDDSKKDANGERPRTVKIFNAKMRSTGLEEEAKPPPPRSSAKKPTTSLPSIPQKRPSPVRDLGPTPPEKKAKLEVPERPGAIKLIPPKPKPPVLQESDMFMDALTASMSAKKEPKKRKRRASVSKDAASPPQQTESAPAPASPTLKSITPPKFYQDTLETSEKEENSEEQTQEEREDEEFERVSEKVPEPKRRVDNGLKGVLVHGKKSGPKKSIKWKADEDLVEIQYFELDETERVNVTKTFMDMARLEMSGEREMLQMSRKLASEDLMESQTNWRFPMMIDLPEALAVPGSKSLEKDIQFAREKNILQALYFSKRLIPDSPAEPEPEIHQMTDPVMIPLDDPENSTETDLRNTPWPEPKGSPPPEPTPPVIPHIFPAIQTPFSNFPNIGPPPNAFPNVQQFQGPPGGFIPPNVIPPGDWTGMGNGPPMGPPNMPPPEMMNQGPMGHMFGHAQEGFNPMMNDGSFAPMHFNQQQNMFPPQNNFNMNRGARGGFRRGGGGPWIRMNGPGGWNRGGHRGGRLCKNVKNHGYCRNRDNCPFIHPNN